MLLVLFVLASLCFVACKDDYIWDDPNPKGIGANIHESIYDFMEKDGHFTIFLRLIDDLNYKTVLSKTGSKTLLPAQDEAFVRFFQDNPYDAKSYEELSTAQKQEILNVSMINMAYLSKMLSNVAGSSDGQGLGEGMALRRRASSSYLDTLALVKDEALFAANDYWASYRNKGLYLLENDAPRMIVHFTQSNMFRQGITNDDFSLLFNGETYVDNTIYINGTKVLEADVYCKNGYVHVMQDVLLPVKNMAQIIRDNGETDLFNSLINRFSAPFYSEARTQEVREYYDGSKADRPLIMDSVFIKTYFTESAANAPDGKDMSSEGLLFYDPSDNAYSSQQDMGAMFVPTDQAMNDYINGPRGQYLKDAYQSWENVPNQLLAMFIKNHQKRSFLNSLPHEWGTMTDESSFDMHVSRGHVLKTYIGGNGAVYITNTVYPPIDFQCVYASVMASPNTTIMDWTIRHDNASMKFYLYLRSMENMYNLIVPTDEALQDYRDPISWAIGGSERQIWAFRYIPENTRVYADAYAVNPDGTKGALIETKTDQTVVLNRLKDILDSHIVVGYKDKATGIMSGHIDGGSIEYALTKGGTMLKITDAGDQMKLSGGGDIEQQTSPAEIMVNTDNGGALSRYESDNGRTWFIDKVLHEPVQSVYDVLSVHSEYAEFFELCQGDTRVFDTFKDDKDVNNNIIFSAKRVGSTSGLGMVVNSFNNFRYTVFVPTKTAIDAAFAADSKLFTWDDIAADEDYDSKKEKTLYLLKFLKYHFMDNFIFIDEKSPSGSINEEYETAARNPLGKFHKLTLNTSGADLLIDGEKQGNRAKVIKTEGLYNLMTRDYIVNSSNYVTATQIVASSHAVIHLIDTALKFE